MKIFGLSQEDIKSQKEKIVEELMSWHRPLKTKFWVCTTNSCALPLQSGIILIEDEFTPASCKILTIRLLVPEKNGDLEGDLKADLESGNAFATVTSDGDSGDDVWSKLVASAGPIKFFKKASKRMFDVLKRVGI